MVLEYDGTDFHGWQIQPKRRTVQGELERSLWKVLGERVVVTGAGRTDAGVHATFQVANFLTNVNRKLQVIKNGLESVLPDDISVRKIKEVPLNFHSRFDAKARVYQYKIRLEKSPIERRTCWEIKFPLNLKLMKKASRFLVGRHNFSSFCSSNSESENRICDIKRMKWKENGKGIFFEIEANRFLTKMVRNIVGTLVDVGRGRLEVSEFKKIIELEDRRKAGKTAPAKGLCLVNVKY